MRKYFSLLFAVLFFTLPLVAQHEWKENKFYAQKQIFIDGSFTCQAVQIHKNWFLTAAHCFKEKTSCNVRIVLAQGDLAKVSVVVPCEKVYFPEEITTQDKQTILPWDMALIHYEAESAPYEYHRTDGEWISGETFREILQIDGRLNKQWEFHTRAFKEPSLFLLPLYTYQNQIGRILLNNIVVALRSNGNITYLENDEHAVYLGKKSPSLWVTPGFGVENGNSGGAVWAILPDDKLGLIGIVSAKQPNTLDPEVAARMEQFVPGFARTDEFFIFNGFADTRTLRFIRETLAAHHDYIKTEKIRRVLFPQDPTVETYQIKAD